MDISWFNLKRCGSLCKRDVALRPGMALEINQRRIYDEIKRLDKRN